MPQAEALRHNPEKRSRRPTDIDLVNAFDAERIKYIFQVPCSITKTVSDMWHKKSEQESGYGRITLINLTNEASLVGAATGVYLATGKIPLIHCQNTGYSNMIDPLKFAQVYRIPILSLETLRGNSPKDNSEPHLATGAITERLTKLTVGKDHVFGNRYGRKILQNIHDASDDARKGNVATILLSPNAFREEHALSPLPTSGVIFSQAEEDEELERKNYNLLKIELIKGRLSNPFRPADKRLSRDTALEMIEELHPNALFIESNGYTARAGQTVAKREGHFHNAGYMGGGLAIGYGAAMSNPDLEVVVVDGDQNAQMGIPMLNLLESTFLSLPNLTLYMLDNRTGASVGTPKSVELMRIFDTFYRKIPTIADGHLLPFDHFRVGARGVHFDNKEAMALAKEIGPLPVITQKVRGFADAQTANKRGQRRTQSPISVDV